MLRANAFEPYIRYIRFPRFRNLRDNLRIDFEHPITVLVGSNGTNKTAILRALQGCPDYVNVGQYWFSTNLDPISPEERHRFIHGYLSKSSGQIVESIKVRINRQDNPDYFEPSRPLVGDGMQRMPEVPRGATLPPERTSTRWKAIQKRVLYLDFRSELSAYDKYFYHSAFDRNISTLANKKEFVRRRAFYLATALSDGRDSHVYYKMERIAEKAAELTAEEREMVSEILGRSYDSIKIIRHRYFNVEGYSVVMRATGLQYSEAFAGSGEFAVVILVKKVSEAPERSLILLDEPEVSLHPGAQQKLMVLLAKMAKSKKHQFVISTHSPEFVRELPPQAIKVFQPSQVDGRVDLLSQQSDPSEAFFRLGIRVTEKRRVYVEDGLAAALVRRATRPLGEALNSTFTITPLPGGAGAIKTRFVPTFALAGYDRCLVLLDGDQRPSSSVPSAVDIPDGELESVMAEFMGARIQLSLNGNQGNFSQTEKRQQLRKVLDWCSSHLDFLPGTDPEALLLGMEGIEVSGPSKEYWSERARSSLGRPAWEQVTATEILGEQERALARLDPDQEDLASIRRTVSAFLERSGP